jgi:hypothetical protein
MSVTYTLAEWKAWEEKQERESNLNALAFEQWKHIMLAWVIPGLACYPGHMRRFGCQLIAWRSDRRVRLFVLNATPSKEEGR